MSRNEALSGAFCGDSYIEAEVRRLVEQWKVETIVETGTWRGETTRALAGMGAVQVVTIELEPQRETLWHLEGVRQFIGNSGKLLGYLISILQGPFLFYLDAHGGAHSPLLDELGAIAASRIKPVIVIHDFFNPERPAYGFDTWDIGPYRLELVEPALKEIYGPGGYRYWYNGSASGPLKRGVIYLEPKEL